jgi:Rrf2 family transcriptional regulator, nitric oxide-sensitive transcriptional repressor
MIYLKRGFAVKLSKGSYFALIAVLELAREPDRQLSTADIGGKYGISTSYLAKVMRNLVRKGLVQTVRGSGRYRFVGNAGRTTLLDVIGLFEALVSELDLPRRSQAAVPIMAELQCINQEIDDLTRAVLDSITLETALKCARQPTKTTVRNSGATDHPPPAFSCA